MNPEGTPVVAAILQVALGRGPKDCGYENGKR
jgi:hypothetical protein